MAVDPRILQLIRTLARQAARDWLGHRDQPDEYGSLPGTPGDESGKMRQVSVFPLLAISGRLRYRKLRRL